VVETAEAAQIQTIAVAMIRLMMKDAAGTVEVAQTLMTAAEMIKTTTIKNKF
jgi:hypothetical protein